MSTRLAAIVAALALAAPAGAAGNRAYWPLKKVMSAIDGKRVTVNGRTVRIERDTTLCSGRGRARRVSGVRGWARFACTSTTFANNAPDIDVDFNVRILDARRFRITDVASVGAGR